jgi:molecular chaperone DnaK
MRGGKAEMIPSAEGTTDGGKSVPSYVAYDKEWKIMVGKPAQHQAISNPGGTVKKFKRSMGSDKKWPVCPKGQTVTKEFTPVELSAEILKKIKADAEKYLGVAVNKAVVTVPANFDDNQKAATKAAGEKAGLIVMDMINEPTAAALAYGINELGKNEKILVFDMGGGTLDITIMDFHNGYFEVNSSAGDTEFGGSNIDKVIVDRLMDEILSKYKEANLSEGSKTRMKLEEECESAKKMLSGIDEVKIIIPYVANEEDFERTLTRKELEGWIGPMIQKRCHRPIDEALNALELTIGEIEKVILVGGPTKMPIVKKFMEDKFGAEKIAGGGGVDPMECVCFGAAVKASKVSTETFNVATDVETKKITSAIKIIDVTTHNLGVECVGNVFSMLIPRNTPTSPPAKGKDYYYTVVDDQTSILFPVWQTQGDGESVTESGFVRLGEVNIDGITPAPKGTDRFEVTFEVGSDGLVKVHITNLTTGKQVKGEIQSKLRQMGDRR